MSTPKTFRDLYDEMLRIAAPGTPWICADGTELDFIVYPLSHDSARTNIDHPGYNDDFDSVERREMDARNCVYACVDYFPRAHAWDAVTDKLVEYEQRRVCG